MTKSQKTVEQRYTEVADWPRRRLIACLLEFNPWGGYQTQTGPDADESLRRTILRYEFGPEAVLAWQAQVALKR